MSANRNLKAYIGLGNQGKEYRHTYHNIGALAAECFSGFAQETGRADLLFMVPAGFMNQSGLKVAPWLKQENIAADQFILVHDESDLPVGEYKITFGGSSAGHKGVQSVIDALGTDQFWRLRIGIRSKEEQVRAKAIDFVLKRYGLRDKMVFSEVLRKAWVELNQEG